MEHFCITLSSLETTGNSRLKKGTKSRNIRWWRWSWRRRGRWTPFWTGKWDRRRRRAAAAPRERPRRRTTVSHSTRPSPSAAHILNHYAVCENRDSRANYARKILEFTFSIKIIYGSHKKKFRFQRKLDTLITVSVKTFTI